MNKRGQFFLIAAFVIVGIIVSLSTIYIAIRAPREETKVYDLSKEINEETAQLVTQGSLINSPDIAKRIDSLIGSYSTAYPDSEIAIIYGKKGSSPTLAKYFKCDDASTQLETSALYTCVKRQPLDLLNDIGDNRGQLSVSSGNITTTLKGRNYNFAPPENQDNYFYIIVRMPKGGEQTVATSKQ